MLPMPEDEGHVQDCESSSSPSKERPPIRSIPVHENNNMGGEERRDQPSPIREPPSPIRGHRRRTVPHKDCAYRRPEYHEEPEPYSPRILALTYSQGFKMLTTTKYDRSTDPRVHISDFDTLMRAHQVVDDLRCVLFPVTLTGVAKTWFKKFKRHSITSWDKLSRDLKKELRGSKARKLKCSCLTNVKQQPGESLKAYINHFNVEAAKAKDVDDNRRLMALGVGITNGSQFWDSLQGKGARTIDEFMKRAQTYINREEARCLSVQAPNPRHGSPRRPLAERSSPRCWFFCRGLTWALVTRTSL
ncbi:hypothetical protein F8388_015751 [Cannabis sativa]|uniref:Retrotransposon gag domain-containing protein n=1 Tax=Cannabis sativa TaxID=3483 RepID=A0A7J6E644_CANSA|nr:hypothetical protein F8388_015751 [Cannabis sativa]